MLLRSVILFAALTACAAVDDPGTPGTPNTPGTPGTPGDPPENCPSTVVDMPTASACAQATQTCFTACGETEDETCFDNCFAAEPNADNCGTCLEDAFVACANAAGCQAAYDAQECCIGTCADPDAEECYTTTCATEVAAFESCAEAVECDDTVCFAP